MVSIVSWPSTLAAVYSYNKIALIIISTQIALCYTYCLHCDPNLSIEPDKQLLENTCYQLRAACQLANVSLDTLSLYLNGVV